MVINLGYPNHLQNPQRQQKLRTCSLKTPSDKGGSKVVLEDLEVATVVSVPNLCKNARHRHCHGSSSDERRVPRRRPGAPHQIPYILPLLSSLCASLTLSPVVVSTGRRQRVCADELARCVRRLEAQFAERLVEWKTEVAAALMRLDGCVVSTKLLRRLSCIRYQHC